MPKIRGKRSPTQIGMAKLIKMSFLIHVHRLPPLRQSSRNQHFNIGHEQDKGFYSSDIGDF